MEIEYKWDLRQSNDAHIALEAAEMISPYVRGVEGISMNAAYYDTPEGLVHRKNGGLRLREENGARVCCLKITVDDGAGCAARQEFEAKAADIRSGIAALPAAGAPQELCEELLASELAVLCETQFERRAFSLEAGAGDKRFEAELAFDEGVLRREGREQEIREMELEHKGGSLQAFHAFAQRIEDKLSLTRQPLSKLARAMRV